MSISFVCLGCFHKQQSGRLQQKYSWLHRVTYQHSHPADYSISCFNLKGPCTFYFKFDGAVLRVTSRPINEDQFRFVIDVVDALTLELGIAERLDNVTKRLEKFESTLNQLKMLADFLAPGQKR